MENMKRSASKGASTANESITRIAEEAVISKLLLEPEKFEEILSIIDVDDFYYVPTKTIFKAIKELYEENKGMDATSVFNKLTEEGKLSLIGGEKVFFRYAFEGQGDNFLDLDKIGTVEENARILKRKSDQRRIRDLGKSIKEMALNVDPTELLASVDNALDELTPKIDRDIKIDLKSQKEEIMKELNEPDDFKQSSIFKGFRFKAGDIVLLKGATGHGKTTIALNVTADLLAGAKTSNEPFSVFYFTFEQRRKEIISWIARILGREAKEEIEELIDAKGDKLNVLYGVNRIVDIEAYVRKWARLRGPLDLVVIDYDTYLEPMGRYDNEERRVNAISKSLKRMAVKYDTTVLLLSQVNKDGKSKWGMVKEEDASVVIAIGASSEQEETLNSNSSEWSINLKVVKSRNGAFGEETLTFDRKTRALKTKYKRVELE